VAEPEQAAFLNDLPGESPTGFSRLYYGAEFCFWRLPSIEKTLASIAWARRANWTYTLVTPVLGEAERRQLDSFFKVVLPEMTAGDEVLISDWGALELVRSVRVDLTVILGRTLSGQKRGPRILDMNLGDEQSDYFRRGAWHNREAVALLVEKEVTRIEQDNLLQGLAPLPKPLKGSLHLPYAMVASSRNCPFRTSPEFGSCAAPCGEIFTLRTEETEPLLYQDGNTQFLHNEMLPNDLSTLGINRIVTHPELAA
jgi:hypothetical protein